MNYPMSESTVSAVETMIYVFGLGGIIMGIGLGCVAASYTLPNLLERKWGVVLTILGFVVMLYGHTWFIQHDVRFIQDGVTFLQSK